MALSSARLSLDGGLVSTIRYRSHNFCVVHSAKLSLSQTFIRFYSHQRREVWQAMSCNESPVLGHCHIWNWASCVFIKPHHLHWNFFCILLGWKLWIVVAVVTYFYIFSLKIGLAMSLLGSCSCPEGWRLQGMAVVIWHPPPDVSLGSYKSTFRFRSQRTKSALCNFQKSADQNLQRSGLHQEINYSSLLIAVLIIVPMSIF